jgi:hypothetical protein
VIVLPNLDDFSPGTRGSAAPLEASSAGVDCAKVLAPSDIGEFVVLYLELSVVTPVDAYGSSDQFGEPESGRIFGVVVYCPWLPTCWTTPIPATSGHVVF